MMLAAKLEDVFAPSVDDLVDISANTFDHKEFVGYEMIVSQALKFRLSTVTPFHFISIFLRAANANERMVHFVWYLAELALQHYIFTGITASKLAAAILNLARQTLMPRSAANRLRFDDPRFAVYFEETQNAMITNSFSDTDSSVESGSSTSDRYDSDSDYGSDSDPELEYETRSSKSCKNGKIGSDSNDDDGNSAVLNDDNEKASCVSENPEIPIEVRAKRRRRVSLSSSIASSRSSSSMPYSSDCKSTSRLRFSLTPGLSSDANTAIVTPASALVTQRSSRHRKAGRHHRRHGNRRGRSRRRTRGNIRADCGDDSNEKTAFETKQHRRSEKNNEGSGSHNAERRRCCTFDPALESAVVWTPTLQYYACYTPCELEAIVRCLWRVHFEAWNHPKYTAICLKYQRKDKLHVSHFVTALREDDLRFD